MCTLLSVHNLGIREKSNIVFFTLLQHKRRLQVLFFFLSLELGKATSYPFGKNKYVYLWRSKEMTESFRCIFLRIIVFDSLLLIQRTHINVMLRFQSGKFMKQKKNLHKKYSSKKSGSAVLSIIKEMLCIAR